MSIKKLVLSYFVLFFATAIIVVGVGDYLSYSYHNAEKNIFHAENISEFVNFLKGLNIEKDTVIIRHYFTGHINHYTNLKLIGLYKKMDSLLILTLKTYKNLSREFLNINDTFNLNTFEVSNFDSIILRLPQGNYLLMRINPNSPYFLGTLLDKNQFTGKNMYFYITRLFLAFYFLLFLFITTRFLSEKVLIRNINMIKSIIRSLPEKEANCSEKTGVIEFDEVCEELSELSKRMGKKQQQFYEESIKDPLTGAFNLRKFYDDIEDTRKESITHKSGFVLLILDVDNFKQINDTFGHLEGDKALKEVVHIIKRNIRDTDGVYRYGGDEFTVILRNIDEEGAYRIAERIRKEVEKNTKTTVSIGGSYFFVAYTSTELMREADRKLYIAKKLGKNRTVILWEDTENMFREFGKYKE